MRSVDPPLKTYPSSSYGERLYKRRSARPLLACPRRRPHQCDLCPRERKLHEGQRGLCFVRARTGDQIVLTTYGRSSGFCLDPREKKPLNHFLPGTAVLSFGTAGCNLTCKFCQNWDISKASVFDRLQQRASPHAIARAARAMGARSVAFTYNDPVIFLEYAVDVAAACREVGLQAVAVTAGYIASLRDQSSSPRWTPPISISRRSPRASISNFARVRSRPFSIRSSTSNTRRRHGSRSPACLFQARTIRR